MFIRKRKNPSGTVSIQIIDKSNGKYKVVETIACVKDKKELEFYLAKAESRLKQLNPNLFDTVEFNEKKHRFIAIKNKEISVVGPDIIFGYIMEYIRFYIIKKSVSTFYNWFNTRNIIINIKNLNYCINSL